ncbi:MULTISPECIES: hypothetical protein [unclassified Streptomyces]|nr:MULTISPECIES: hypothetical protein [unclassified Streptomyces]MYT30460.1 hypothetical protein [Streptomyces sp. SID8354]
MAVIPPDLLDRLRRLEEDVRELRGRLPARPEDAPAPQGTTPDNQL